MRYLILAGALTLAASAAHADWRQDRFAHQMCANSSNYELCRLRETIEAERYAPPANGLYAPMPPTLSKNCPPGIAVCEEGWDR